jgi:hypothetical protein
MTISATEAIQRLNTNPSAYVTKASLLALLREVSIDSPGNVTVAYSGTLMPQLAKLAM